MKLSCTPISFANSFKQNEMDLKGFIAFCAQHGCEAVDVLDPAHYTWMWRDPAAELRQLPKLLESAGLVLAAYGCGNNFAKNDAAERDAQVEMVQSAIRQAAELQAPVIRIFGGHLAQGHGDAGIESHNGMTLVREGIERCLPAAEKAGIVLALENHGALPGHAFELAALIKYFNSPCLQCTFDCANFLGNNMLEPEDPLRALDQLADHVAFVHVKDFMSNPEPDSGRRVKACVAGEGLVPLRQLTAALEMHGYEGFCSLEYEASATVPEREGTARSLAYLRELQALHAVLQLNPTTSSTH